MPAYDKLRLRRLGGPMVCASLEHRVALGATVRYVDRGIDTGAAIERRLLPAVPGGAELGAPERRSHPGARSWT